MGFRACLGLIIGPTPPTPPRFCSGVAAEYDDYSAPATLARLLPHLPCQVPFASTDGGGLEERWCDGEVCETGRRLATVLVPGHPSGKITVESLANIKVLVLGRKKQAAAPLLRLGNPAQAQRQTREPPATHAHANTNQSPQQATYPPLDFFAAKPEGPVRKKRLFFPC